MSREAKACVALGVLDRSATEAQAGGSEYCTRDSRSTREAAVQVVGSATHRRHTCTPIGRDVRCRGATHSTQSACAHQAPSRRAGESSFLGQTASGNVIRRLRRAIARRSGWGWWRRSRRREVTGPNRDAAAREIDSSDRARGPEVARRIGRYGDNPGLDSHGCQRAARWRSRLDGPGKGGQIVEVDWREADSRP